MIPRPWRRRCDELTDRRKQTRPSRRLMTRYSSSRRWISPLDCVFQLQQPVGMLTQLSCMLFIAATFFHTHVTVSCSTTHCCHRADLDSAASMTSACRPRRTTGSIWRKSPASSNTLPPNTLSVSIISRSVRSSASNRHGRFIPNNQLRVTN